IFVIQLLFTSTLTFSFVNDRIIPICIFRSVELFHGVFMKKYLMLDIDGVLNSSRTVIVYEGYGHGWEPFSPKFDPVAVGLLRKLVEDTDAVIIISSSWRITTTYEQFYTIFDQYGWDTRDIIKGQTP